MDNQYKDECEHKYVHLSTHYNREVSSYKTRYTRLDVYFCERCLKQEKTITDEYVYTNDPTPLWWQH